MKPQKKKYLELQQIMKKLRSVKNNQKQFCLDQFQVQGLCAMMKNILEQQPMLLQLKTPIRICGDTHGQYKDLTKIFQLFGQPDKKSYLFLGDYVDRGKQSLECICLLMAYKIKYKNTFFLIRGNHQASQLNKLYGFYDQCKRRLSIKCWKIISSTFNYFPIAAIVGERIFCVHGGLSPLLKTLSFFTKISRPIQPSTNKIISDMLWSDPKQGLEGWTDNFDRGISFYYGKNVVNLFLAKYDLDFICRSHQVVEEGYQFLFDKKVLTLFSAPNYCGQFVNLAAVLIVNQNLVCRLEHFEGNPLEAHRKPRPVTPLGRQSRQLNKSFIRRTVLNQSVTFKQQLKNEIENKQNKKQNLLQRLQTVKIGKHSKRRATSCVTQNDLMQLQKRMTEDQKQELAKPI